jgi:hypothetical protein
MSTSNLQPIRPPNLTGPRLRAAPYPVTLFGSLEVVSPLDLLEWLCSNKKSWTIKLHGKEMDGEVTVLDGQIVDARWGSLRGMEALSKIADCQQGLFELVPVTEPVERTLHGHWQGLLLGAVQRLDERNLPGKVPAAAIVHLIDQGFAALRAGDVALARQRWTEALAQDPHNRSLRFNLRKLDSRI